jgi:hypothetical protein
MLANRTGKSLAHAAVAPPSSPIRCTTQRMVPSVKGDLTMKVSAAACEEVFTRSG